MRKIYLALVLGLAVMPGRVLGGDVLPPSPLLDWLDYALKRFPPDDCPKLAEGHKVCAAVTELIVDGDLKTGKVNLIFKGDNWSREKQTLTLIGPTTTVSLQDASVTLTEQTEEIDPLFIAPYFAQSGESWQIDVPPSHFQVNVTAHFDLQNVMAVTLAQGIGRIDTKNLRGGSLRFIDSLGQHGGEAQFLLEGINETAVEESVIHTTRVFTWGAVPTFTYFIAVSGIHKDTLLKLPLLGTEVIEKLEPDKPYTVEGDFLHLNAASGQIKISGHYQDVPQRFVLDKNRAFEIWLHVADRRHPVNLITNAVPADPGEFSDLTQTAFAKAFLVKGGEEIAFKPITLSRDEGRKGVGDSHYRFYQGEDGHWLEKLFLKAKILTFDRLVIPTANAPTFAGIDGEGVELFHEDNNLSVRLPQGEEIEVVWNHRQNVNPFFKIIKRKLPRQRIYLENQTASFWFKDGFIPVLAWGADVKTGDLLDRFHLYGFLIGIFAFALCRGLKLNLTLSTLLSLLFIGLYTVDGFPLVRLLVLLLVSLPLMRLKQDSLEKLKGKPWLKRLLQTAWVLVFTVALIPLSLYARDRVFSALYPQASPLTQGPGLTMGLTAGEVPQTNQAPSFPEGSLMDQTNRPQSLPKSLGPSKVDDAGPYEQKGLKVSEWNAKPVNIFTPIVKGPSVELTQFTVSEEDEREVVVFVAGPIARALWMFAEVVLLFLLTVSLLKKIKELFV